MGLGPMDPMLGILVSALEPLLSPPFAISPRAATSRYESLDCSPSCLSIISTLSRSWRVMDLELLLLLLLPLLPEGPDLLALGLRELLPPLFPLFPLGAAPPLCTLPLPFPVPHMGGWKALHPGEGPDLQRSLEHGRGGGRRRGVHFLPPPLFPPRCAVL